VLFLCFFIALVVLSVAYMCYNTSSLRDFLVFSPPQVAKVPGITGLDLLRHGTYVGVACDNNVEVSGLAFTDSALWMSATSTADVTPV